jgi:hypothetical protein
MTTIKTVPVDKIYKLKSGAAPISFTLASRNNKRFPLLWFDEANNVNRPLRYAINQKSPFEDEQDGNAIVEPIIFEDGFLHVPKNNPVLQAFLYYHPLNNISFVEVDKEKDATKELEKLSNEVDALISAKKLDVKEMETVARVLFGKDPSLLTTSELKRDILVFAKKYPNEFLNTVNDPMLIFQSDVRMFFDKKLLHFRNNMKEVWLNTSTNKKRMINVPYGEEPYSAVASYLRSEEGIEILKMLENIFD